MASFRSKGYDEVLYRDSTTAHWTRQLMIVPVWKIHEIQCLHRDNTASRWLLQGWKNCPSSFQCVIKRLRNLRRRWHSMLRSPAINGEKHYLASWGKTYWAFHNILTTFGYNLLSSMTSMCGCMRRHVVGGTAASRDGFSLITFERPQRVNAAIHRVEVSPEMHIHCFWSALWVIPLCSARRS